MNRWDVLVGDPLAPHVGPFPLRSFLEIYWRHWERGSLHVVAADGSATAVAVVDGVCRFVGGSHLTDYHATLGADTEPLVRGMLDVVEHQGRFDLDSLPLEAAEPLAAAFAEAGLETELSDDEVCWVVHLPARGDDEWERLLSGKDRHELRRKRRRFRDRIGEPEIVRGADHLNAFVALHRAAPGDKGAFMTDAMAEFFGDLLDVPGARLDVLLIAGSAAAAAFGFEDSSAYYLYNSAYDPQYREVSPGIVLVDRLVRGIAASGRHRFDFLKGDEEYKARLGAAPRPLYRLRAWL